MNIAIRFVLAHVVTGNGSSYVQLDEVVGTKDRAKCAAYARHDDNLLTWENSVPCHAPGFAMDLSDRKAA